MKLILNGEAVDISVGSIVSNQIDTIEILSREEYDSLPDHPSTTLYFIKG